MGFSPDCNSPLITLWRYRWELWLDLLWPRKIWIGPTNTTSLYSPVVLLQVLRRDNMRKPSMNNKGCTTSSRTEGHPHGMLAGSKDLYECLKPCCRSPWPTQFSLDGQAPLSPHWRQRERESGAVPLRAPPWLVLTLLYMRCFVLE